MNFNIFINCVTTTIRRQNSYITPWNLLMLAVYSYISHLSTPSPIIIVLSFLTLSNQYNYKNNVIFGDWLFSLSIMCLRSISSLFLFVAEWYSMYGFVTFFTFAHCGTLGLLPVWAIINIVAIANLCTGFLWTYVIISLVYTRIEI